MNKKVRKHNIKVYTESVLAAKKRGAIYVMRAMDKTGDIPLPKSAQYLNDLARKKMAKHNLQNNIV